MGNLTDRLVRKSNPLAREAEALAKALVVQDQEEGETLSREFREHIEAQLQQKGAEDFEALLVAASEALRERAGGDELAATLLSHVDEAIDVEKNGAGRTAGHLFVMPMLVEAPCQAWNLVLSAGWPEAVSRTLYAHDLVTEAPEHITALPLLLCPEECLLWRHGDLLRLRTALRDGDLVQASEVVAETRQRLQMTTDASGAEPQGSIGLVVAFVRTRDEDPFQLSAAKREALEREANNLSSSRKLSSSDVVEMMEFAAAELAVEAGVARLQLVEPATLWSAGTLSVNLLNRSLVAQSVVEALRGAAGLAENVELVADALRPTSDLQGLQVSLSTRRGDPVGVLTWVSFLAEHADECTRCLYRFLTGADIQVLEAGPYPRSHVAPAKPASAVLH